MRKSIIKTVLMTTLAVTGAMILLVVDKQHLFNQPFLVWRATAVGYGANPEIARRAFQKSRVVIQYLLVRFNVKNGITKGDVEVSLAEDSSTSPMKYRVSQRYELISNDLEKLASISAKAAYNAVPDTVIESTNPQYRLTFADLFFGLALVLVIIAAGSFERSPRALSRYPLGLSPPSLVLYIVLIGVLASLALVNATFILPKLGFVLLFGSGVVLTFRWLWITRGSWYKVKLRQVFMMFCTVLLALVVIETLRLTVLRP